MSEDTGAGVGYNLAGIVGGAIPPIVAAPLAAAYGGMALAKGRTLQS